MDRRNFVNAAHTFVCLPSLCYCSINSSSVRRRCLLSIYLSLAEWIQCAMHIAHRLRDALSVRLRSHFRCVFWPSSRVHAADVRTHLCVCVFEYSRTSIRIRVCVCAYSHSPIWVKLSQTNCARYSVLLMLQHIFFRYAKDYSISDKS